MINGRKCLLLAIQCLVLLIGSLVVYVIVEQRDYLSGEVADKISEGWGRSQRIDGPLIISQTDCETRYYPQNFDCHAQLKTQTLHKGIYTAVVYTTDLNLSSHYDELFIVGYPREVSIEIELDVTYIKRLGKLVVNGKEYDWDKTTYSITRNFKPGELAGAVDISTSITLTGSHQLKIVQIGDRSKIVISGDAKDPSFIGKLSPLRREVTDNTFEAEWVSEEITASRRESARYDFAGVDVLTGLDCYKKVARCLKYAILIILFTYCSVMFTEIVTRKNVPLLNYFLIGVALIIFYTLLLSFAEWMPFF